jgi:REP-associated tyrosine transposase
VFVNHPGNIIQETSMHLAVFSPIRIDEWVLMPNHMHGIIWILEHRRGKASILADASPPHTPIGTKPSSLGAFIQNFKSVSTRKIYQLIQGSRSGEINPANLTPPRLWQRNYY